MRSSTIWPGPIQKKILLSIGIGCLVFLLQEEQINEEKVVARILESQESLSDIYRHDSSDRQDSVVNRILDCKVSEEKLTRLDKLNGKTIYMFGDSTMVQQAFTLCALINEPPENLENFDESKPYPRNKLPEPEGHFSPHFRVCENEHVRLAFFKGNNYDFRRLEYVEWLYRELAKYDKITNQEHRTAPNVIYFNGGIHFLYLPLDMRHSGALHDDLLGWRDAETYVNRFITGIKSYLAPGGRIVFMSSHFIDDGKRHQLVASKIREWYENPMKFAQPCIELLDQKTELFKEQGYNVTDVCFEAAQTSQGVKTLDDRVKVAVAAAADELGIDIGCVDGYEHTFGRADDTLDGVHYPPLARFELSSLVDAIE